MALRELLLSLGVEVDKKGVQNAGAALGKLKKAALVAAAAFAGIKAAKAIGGMVDGVREMGDEIDKTSKQLGLGVEELQEWRFAAGLAGVGAQEMSNSLGRLQKNAFEAAKGNKTLREDFKKLGVEVLDAEGNLKNADTLLTEMSDGFKGLDNDTEKVALSLNLMGRTGRKLLPLFEDGSDGIAAMRKEAQELGGIMDQDLIDATVRLTDDQFRAQMAWQGLKNQIAGAVIPIFIKFSNIMIGLAKAISGPLKTAINTIKIIFTGLKRILDFIIEGWVMISEVIGEVSTALLLLGGLLLVFGKTAVLVAIKTAVAWAIAAAPFVLIAALIAAILLLLEDFIVFMKGGDSLIGRLIASFRRWVKQMGGAAGAVGKIFETLFKRLFGLSDETATKIGAVFAAVAEVIKFIFVKIPETILFALEAAWEFWSDFGEKVANLLNDMFEWVGDFVEGFVGAFSDAISSVIDALNELIGAATDALGITSIGEDKARLRREAAAHDARARKRKLERVKEEQRRIRVFKKLEAEGFGTFVPGRETATQIFTPGLTAAPGMQAAAEARAAELHRNINAPLTVNVDARGQTNPAAIGNTVADKVQVAQNRQAMNNFTSR